MRQRTHRNRIRGELGGAHGSSQQVKAMHAGTWGPAGTLFSVSVGPTESKRALKAKLAPLTGIPIESQKLMLGAFAQACFFALNSHLLHPSPELRTLRNKLPRYLRCFCSDQPRSFTDALLRVYFGRMARSIKNSP